MREVKIIVLNLLERSIARLLIHVMKWRIVYVQLVGLNLSIHLVNTDSVLYKFDDIEIMRVHLIPLINIYNNITIVFLILYLIVTEIISTSNGRRILENEEIPKG